LGFEPPVADRRPFPRACSCLPAAILHTFIAESKECGGPNRHFVETKAILASQPVQVTATVNFFAGSFNGFNGAHPSSNSGQRKFESLMVRLSNH
jgi:hypothetical protein